MSVSCRSSPLLQSPSPFLASTKYQAVVSTHVYYCLSGGESGGKLLPQVAFIVRDYLLLTYDDQKNTPKEVVNASWNRYLSSNDPIFICYLKNTPLFRFASLGIPERDPPFGCLLRRVEVMHSAEALQGNSVMDLPQTKPATLSYPQSLAARHREEL